MASPGTVTIAPFEGDKILKMLKAAALTHAIAETARMEWKTYDESTVLNALYALGSLWGKERPGYVDVHVASAREVLPRYEQVLDQYLSALVRSLAQGPVEVHNCLHRIERIHDIDRDKVRSMLQDSHLINQQVALELGEVVQQLAAIPAASTIAFTLLGGGVALYSLALGTGAALGTAGYAASAAAFTPTASAAGFLGMGYGITGSVVKSWYEVPNAQALAISTAAEAGKTALKEVPGKLADHFIESAGKSRDLHERSASFLNSAIRRRAQEVQMMAEGQARQRAEQTLGRFHSANVAAHTRIGVSKLKVGAGAFLQGFLVVFLAYQDMQDAVEEYTKTVESVR